MKVGNEKNTGKLELIAHKSFANYDQMYLVVDFLNKSLKDKRLMFGLTKDSSNEKMTITIYEI